MPSSHLGSALWRNFRVYQVFGANTNVGKTIFSTLFCRAARNRNRADNIWYLKPVSTGPFDDADKWHLDRFARGANTQDFYQFDEPVSPHLAAINHKVTDEAVLEKLSEQIKINAANGPGFMLVETAGGPHSPGPSGTSQADMFRSLRLPVLFVADWRLGGISTSIASFESMKMRGYDIAGVAVFKDDKYQNYDYFQKYFKQHDIPVLTAPLPPQMSEGHDHASMGDFYLAAEKTSSKLPNRESWTVYDFTEDLINRHEARVNRLESMAEKARRHIWWPFTQHQGIKPENVNTIDSAFGDHFQTFRTSETVKTGDAASGAPSMLQSTVDGSASWWSQGLGHGNNLLTGAAAYAAGRYGHVMFAEGIHEPALSLAERLLKLTRNPRLSRVFFSDNGSTGMEVAIKMALKATIQRYEWDDIAADTEMIGIEGAYHGDTLGTMDMAEASVYNEKVPWYRTRGHFFKPPTVKMQKGMWVVQKPESLQEELGPDTEYASLQSVFDQARDSSDEAQSYENYIRATLEHLTQVEKRHFGALVMEPVVLGAGGMTLIDPLFQRTLANVVRDSTALFQSSTRPLPMDPYHVSWRGLPIIHDEVFTGLYRLGHPTSSALIGIQPDISVHAKLLTGGLVPLCTTLASENIFEASLSDSKVDSLLHGHSYTAHPVGCSVANQSLKSMNDLDEEGYWDSFKNDWSRGRPMLSDITSGIRDAAANIMPNSDAAKASHSEPPPPIWSAWSTGFVSALSHATDKIDGVWAMGSVLSISLKDDGGAGYTSTAAKGVQQKLLKDDQGSGWNIHSRVLGNVIYLMTSQITKEEDVRVWEKRVKHAIGV